MDVGVVDESLCDAESRPEDRHRKCKTMDCPARFEAFQGFGSSLLLLLGFPKFYHPRHPSPSCLPQVVGRWLAAVHGHLWI